MRVEKLYCDRCHCEIKVRGNGTYHCRFSIGDIATYDLCPECYSSLGKLVSEWMNEEREEE